MLFCQRCQSRPAITQVADSQGVPWSLCAACAGQGQVPAGFQILMLPALTYATPSPARPCCPACRQHWQVIQESSRLGCPECYRFFRQPLKGILQRLHGQTRHRGRSPGRESQTEEKSDWLRQQLQQAIADERYEDAANWRDKLRQLEAEESCD